MTTTLSKVLAVSMLLCGVFVSYVFLSKLTLTILGIASSPSGAESTHLSSEPAVQQWSLENATTFEPGLTNRLYRQEVCYISFVFLPAYLIDTSLFFHSDLQQGSSPSQQTSSARLQKVSCAQEPINQP